MRHQPRPMFGCRRQAVDKKPLVQLEGNRVAPPFGKRQRTFELPARNRGAADRTAVARHAVRTVERHHAVVGNALEFTEVLCRTARGDVELHTAFVRLTQRLARRIGHTVRTEAHQRSVDIEKERLESSVFRHFSCLFHYPYAPPTGYTPPPCCAVTVCRPSSPCPSRGAHRSP